MTNWATNYLHITGTAGALQKIKDAFVQERVPSSGLLDFDFNALVPAPTGDDAPYNVTEWRWGHWGTKWLGDGVSILCDEPGRLAVMFGTAGNAPLSIFRHIEGMEGIESVEYFCLDGGGDDPTYSMDWAKWFEVEKFSMTDEGDVEDEEDTLWGYDVSLREKAA